ncbi:MAG: TlpA disulfide reductase family protein [Planctomycetia bacterium]|nr:TlpA disulfide reductase family protein [Planctomycetia bacterium]
MSETRHFGPISRHARWTTWLLLALLVVAFLILFSMSGNRTKDAERGPAVGRKLPALDLLPLTGGGSAVTLDDLRGKVVLVNLWATWCPPCRMELPELAALAKDLSDEPDFRLLAVVCDEGDAGSVRAETEATLRRLDVDLPTYADRDFATQTAFDRIARLESIPTTFLLDRDGVIRAVWNGYARGAVDEMQSIARQLLDESGRVARP